MKLSLAWIFEYIDAPLSRYTVTDIVDRFNSTTAEIERWYPVHFKKDDFAAATVTVLEDGLVTLHCAEWSRDVVLPARSDVAAGRTFIIKKNAKNAYAWASLVDWHSTKDGLLPAMHITPEQMRGGWKDRLEQTDYIIEIDNKSITHRPDLWGHRGIAREIAAMLHVPFKESAAHYASLPVHYADKKSAFSKEHPYTVEIDTTQHTKALAAVHIPYVAYQHSVPWMAYRLCIVDIRPWDMLVDATNYVMMDLGHPLHAFDASQISGGLVAARMAHAGQQLELLDGTTITLRADDIVIADKKQALSLAGIMGGKHSSITPHVNGLLLEAAAFHAPTIRHTAAHHKKRTDASMRFEKSLGGHQAIAALKRYVQILADCGVPCAGISDIVALGTYPERSTIMISHAYIQKRLGATLEVEKIQSVLQALGFDVTFHTNHQGGEYAVVVPTDRTKEITLKEDILEEIGRSIGYRSLDIRTPQIRATISDLSPLYRARTIKKVCQYALRLQEVYTYSLYDENFLRTIGWSPEHSIRVKEPLSENRQQLITHLIPQLLHVVAENAPLHDELQFFEMARVWSKKHAGYERSALAGVIYSKKNTLTFYDGKALVDELSATLGIDLEWQKVDAPHEPWFIPYQTAALLHKGVIIGYAGLSHPLFFEAIAPGCAFMFEFDAQALIEFVPKTKRINPLSKFPDVVRDLSILVPSYDAVATLEKAIYAIDTRIVDVVLQDFFEKEEWVGHRSLTFRYTVRDYEKTMTKQESEMLHDRILVELKSYGAQIR
jgi:phenylalanyl-tRNA synthetase beta chain